MYKPLDTSRSEIRILVLYSSKEDSDLVNDEVLHFGLDDDMNTTAARMKFPVGLIKMFKALSYTWGDLTKESSVMLDGHQFPVTENLHAAMSRLRNLIKSAANPDRIVPSFWWIDTICINQDDILERNQQVSVMTRI
jgi:hypothetical protein